MKKLKILSIVSLGIFTIYAIGKSVKELIEVKAYETMKNEIDKVYSENQDIKADFQNEKIKNEELNNKLIKKQKEILFLFNEIKEFKKLNKI